MDNNPLNNHLLQTKSQKLARVSILKGFLVDQIDNNQVIKRLCRYLTKTPLYRRGLTYDGKLVEQPDLIGSLLTETTQDPYAHTKDPIIIPYVFTEGILSEQQITLYVHSPKSSFNTNRGTGFGQDRLLGSHLFLIDIVFPQIYDRVDPYGEERHLMIASEILDLFDGKSVSEELRKVVGDVVFQVVGDITTFRLNKAGYLVTTIPIQVTVPSGRVDESTFDH